MADTVEAALPGNVRCPKCGRDSGRGCVTASGYSAKTHQARWEAVGVAVPTDNQLSLDYQFWLSCRKLEITHLHGRIVTNSGAGA